MIKKNLSPTVQIERSISKKYRKELWNPFIEAVKRYELIRAGDKIAVCMSGGKDSALLAKLMQMLQRFSEVPFELVFLVMDPGYNPENRAKIERNAALLGLPVTVFETDIFDITHRTDRSPCYLCAKMRRGYLYSKARELGCNKIALGHHFNDVVETTVMGMFYSGQLQGMIPKLHSRNFPGMELIRPLYCVHEEDILAWKRYNGLDFLQCACRFTEQRDAAGDGIGPSKRQEIKALLRQLRQHNPNVEKCVFSSLHAVCLDTFPGYKWKQTEHSFLERYDEAAPPTRPVTAADFERNIFTAADGTILPYRLYRPQGEGPFPLLIYLHGAGERGNDNESHLPPVLGWLNQPEHRVRNAMVLAPQCPADRRWVDADWSKGCYRLADTAETPLLRAVAELIDDAAARLPVDGSRLYATGYSMGGFGTWDLLARHPQRFAAGLPICGGGPLDAAGTLADIPLRTFHGAADEIVPVASSRDMADAVGRCHPVDFAYTEWGGKPHNVWDDVYRDPATAAWLLHQRLS